jgi:hypothetical protein
VRSGIIVTVGGDIAVNFSLTVGAVSEKVEVTGDAPQVDTSRATLGGFSEEAEAEVTAKAADNFLREHLCYIAEPLSASLDLSGCSYLAAAGKVLVRRTGARPKQMFDILDEVAAESNAAAFPCGEA